MFIVKIFLIRFDYKVKIIHIFHSSFIYLFIEHKFTLTVRSRDGVALALYSCYLNCKGLLESEFIARKELTMVRSFRPGIAGFPVTYWNNRSLGH